MASNGSPYVLFFILYHRRSGGCVSQIKLISSGHLHCPIVFRCVSVMVRIRTLDTTVDYLWWFGCCLWLYGASTRNSHGLKMSSKSKIGTFSISIFERNRIKSKKKFQLIQDWNLIFCFLLAIGLAMDGLSLNYDGIEFSWVPTTIFSFRV